MAASKESPAPGRAAPAHVPPAPRPPSATVRRGAVVATRSAASTTSGHPTVYQPWVALIAKADARLKTEITAAVRALEADTAEAGQLLDRAYSMAAEAAGHLEQAAWAAFTKYMEAADAARSSIMTPALQQYDHLISGAHDRFTVALADAEKTAKTIVADAGTAKADAGLAVA